MNKNIIISLFLLIILNHLSLFAQQGVNKIEIKKPDIIQKEYQSDIQQGVIGVYDEKFGDAAYDNVFHIEIPDCIQKGDKVFLVYDLFGISDLTGVSRSINDAFSTGGYMQKKDTVWHRQKEQIATSLIQTGMNTIIFNAGQNSYPYKIKNVKLVIENDFTTKINNNISVSFDGRVAVYDDKRIYMKGFVENVEKHSTIEINSQEIFFNGIEFEGIIPKPKTGKITLLIKNEKDIVFQHIYEVTKYIQTEKIAVEAEKIQYKSFHIPAYTSHNIYYKNAGLQIPDSALTIQKEIIIAPLRAIDIAPLESSMVNVTAHNGYRFLPDGTVFNKNVLISIPYDPKRLPAGYTAKDIHSFYFDKQKKKWVLLKKKEVDEKNHVIISYTNHFTDYINGVIKVPESPETASFTPTMMSDIKAASPLEGLTIISPPSASQKGDAQITYPIKIPAGRNGMQPSLKLSYSSNGGNGVLGEGWSMNMPAISLDTRWGIPLFDSDKETEMYMLNGEALMYRKENSNDQDYMPNRHREESGVYTTVLKDREPDIEFSLRKQNAQVKIVRYGDHPNNYYWKVTGSDGTISWYGGYENSFLPDYVLTENSEVNGNIVHWALVKQVDVHGNSINYYYRRDTDTDFSGLSSDDTNVNNGTFFAIQTIKYTGNEIDGTEGNYSVEFDYTYNNNGYVRKDIQISYRNKYKKVVPYTLNTIRVKYLNTLIRLYELQYIKGNFEKTLLHEINNRGTNDSLIDTNTFEYKIFQKHFSFFGDPIIIDNIQDTPWYYLNIDNVLGLSKIDTSEDNKVGFSIRGGFGLEIGNLVKNNSTSNIMFGTTVSYSESSVLGKTKLIDINGDGYLDIVSWTNFMDVPLVKYMPYNKETNTFDSYKLINLHIFSYTKSKMVAGLFSSFDISAGYTPPASPNSSAYHASYNWSKVKNLTKELIYFTDANKDGLIDIVVSDKNDNSIVYFNHLLSNGNVEFTPTSEQTPNLLITADPGIAYPDDEIDDFEQDMENMKYDVVKVWIAPFDGIVDISDVFSIDSTDDVVEYYIETKYNGSPERIYQTIVNTNNSPVNVNLNNINVTEGQMIFFRIHNLTSESIPDLTCNPTIHFTAPEESLDCASNSFTTSYADSFVLSSNQNYHLTPPGDNSTLNSPLTYHFDLNFYNIPLSNNTTGNNDNLNIEIEVIDNINNTGTISNISIPINQAINPADYGTDFTVEVSNVDDKEIRFSISSDDPCYSWNELSYCMDVTINNAPPEWQDFKQSMIANLDINTYAEIENLGYLGALYKGWGQFAFNANFASGDIINQEDIENFDTSQFNIDTSGSPTNINGVSVSTGQDLANAFGNSNDPQSLGTQQNLDLVENINFPPLLPMIPDKQCASDENGIIVNEKWKGLFSGQFSSANAVNPGTFINFQDTFDNLPDYEAMLPTVTPNDFTGMFAIPHKRYSKTKSNTYGAGYGDFSLSHSDSYTLDDQNKTLTNFTDFNGDGYPDIYTPNLIQLTNMTGGHQLTLNNFNNTFFSKADSDSHNEMMNYQTLVQIPISIKPRDGNAKKSIEIPAKAGLSASLNGLTGGSSDTDLWLDINGDGLPDRLYKTNNGVNIKLNTGNDVNGVINFANFIDLHESEPDFGAGFGTGISGTIDVNEIKENISTSNWETSFLPSINTGFNWQTNKTKIILLDINGDGLNDIIYKDTQNGSSAYKVRYNLGNKFTDKKNLSIFNNDIGVSNKSISANLSLGFEILFGIKIIPVPVPIYLKLGPTFGFDGNVSFNSLNVSYADFNGDGYIDIITKYGANGIKIYPSKIAYANKLIKVNHSSGSTFDIDYEQTQATYSDPHGHLVMKQVVVNDGLNITDTNGDDCDGVDAYVTRFDYENAHYDRREREFYGFETLKTLSGKLDTNGDFQVKSKQINKYYNNSYFLNGLLRESSLTNADETLCYTKTVNLYKLTKVGSDGKLTTDIANFETYDVGGSEGRRQAAVLLTESFTDINDDNNYVGKFLRKRQRFDYDELGRVTRVTAYKDYSTQVGNPADYTPFDEVVTEISYDDNTILTDQNIWNTPKELTVRVAGNIVRKRESEYDNYGNMISIKSYFDTNNSLTTTMGYDQVYGNLTKITYPTGMHFIYTYDNVENKFITSIEDAFGYTSTAEYDYKFDKVLLSTDITHNSTAYGYDDAGRLIYVIGPKEYDNGIHSIDIDYYPQGYDPNNDYTTPLAITRHYDAQHPTNTIDTYTFTDGLGRVMQVKKDIEMNGVEKLTAGGKNIYDAYGRIIQTYHPILQDLTFDNQYKVNFDNSEPDYIKYTYDNINRKIAVTDEAGITSTFEYGIEQISVFGNGKIATYVHSISPQTSSVNMEATTYKNIDGNVLTSKVKHDNQDIQTYFEYNAIGEKMRYADDQNIQTTYQYDILGRVTQVQSPDYGRVINYYDEQTGNLKEVQNENLIAGNQSIHYEYSLGRPDKIIFPQINGQQNVANVYFRYGTSGNNTGRLIQQDDATGRQLFDYGKMGEIVSIRRFVSIPNGEQTLFNTDFSYDTWNRIQSIKYPDGEAVNYTYDKGGNLINVTGDMTYIEDIDYDKYEQKTRILYGNGVETNYTYDPQLRRLQQMNTVHSSDEYLNISYTYDYAGNITSTENQAPAWQNITAPYQHTYKYDDMNRLVFASGNVQGNQSQADYELNMQYNSTYGISNKTQNISETNGINTNTTNYSRDYNYFSNTHRLQQIEDAGNTMLTYDYDLNGNISQIDHLQNNAFDKQLYWDEVNRLRVVHNTTGYHYYLYDASGERIIKADAEEMDVAVNGQPVSSGGINFDNIKLYPSGYLVVNGHENYTKHYFAGTQRILSRVMDDANIFYLTKKQSKDSKKFTILQQQDMKRFIPNRTITFTPYEPADNTGKSRLRAPENLYYFHPNHLGTGTLITNGGGEPYQYFVNLPYGETLFEQGGYDYDNPYKFNGKELDQETGLYYYGARYYDSETSIWLSVDPLASERAWASPYDFVQGNPLNRIDIDGMLDNPVFGTDGTYRGTTKEGYTGKVIISDCDIDFSQMIAEELLASDADTYDNVRNTLSGDAKSKIWTHIVSQLEGQQIYDEKFSLSSLSDGQISFSSTDPGSWNSRIKSKTITGTDKYSYETTVENIQASVVVHEWYSHIKKRNSDKISSHRLAYKNVINFKSLWNKTTDAYKGFIVRQLLKYTKDETNRTKVEPLYLNLYNKYKDKR